MVLLKHSSQVHDKKEYTLADIKTERLEVCKFMLYMINCTYPNLTVHVISPPLQPLCRGQSHHKPAWPESPRQHGALAPPPCASSPAGCGCSPREFACQPAVARPLPLRRSNSPADNSQKCEHVHISHVDNSLKIKAELCQDVLLWIAKEPLRWRCPHPWGRKDFQHVPWPLRECWYQVSLQAASGSRFPAFPAVKGPAVPTYGSPACWPARPAQLPGVWHVAGQCCSLLISGRQRGAHIDLPTHEESPEKMRWSHGVMQHIQEMKV